MTMKKNEKDLERLRKRFEALKKSLLMLNHVAQGTITERWIERDDPKRPGEKKKRGPYFQWTFKRKGKTVTVNLSQSQAEIYRKAIEENRNLNDIVDQLRAISLEILEKSTEGVKKRKRED